MAANISNSSLHLPSVANIVADATLLSPFLWPSRIIIFLVTVSLIGLSSWRNFESNKKEKAGLGEVIGNVGDRDFHKALNDGYFKVSIHLPALSQKQNRVR